ncbi:MAG TPA: hypothetical protein VFD92_13295 [Candidatus Binatia bacterium]|nr:hypothetical protein [Candidatus Binatia bacterium]
MIAGLAALACLARPAAARECAGGTLRSLAMGAGGINLTAWITFPGATHDGVIQSPDGLSLEIVDAEDPTQAYLEVSLPADRFTSKPKVTRYDGMGSFAGSIQLRGVPGQSDTVAIRLATASPPALPVPDQASLRVFLSSGNFCARTCVSECERPSPSDPLACGTSAHYVPFADYGFGGLKGATAPATVSPICGLDVRPGGPRCDFLIEEQCLLPYPSSAFLDPDPTTPTGRRIHYDVGSLPTSFDDKPIDPTDWNTLDGFGPGPMIEALFPDTGFPVDRVASGAAFHTDIAPSLDADHPTLLMKWGNGQRVLHFVEMDETAETVDEKVLIMRPGVRLDDATRYIVAIRHLVDTLGNPIRPRAVFRVIRDGIPHDDVALACGEACADAIEARRPALRRVLKRLRKHGVDTSDILLAWDFTTASTEALTGWMVSVRDQATALGTPQFTITSQDTKNGAGFNSDIWVRIQGTFQAPLFMTSPNPGSRLNIVGGMPQQNATTPFAAIPFVVDIPRVAVDAAASGDHPRPKHPARATLWGHGLLGDRFQLGALSGFANQGNVVIGAVDMQGLSFADIGPIAGALGVDLSTFHVVPERLHQGVLNHLLLGRLFADPVNGFSSHAAFKLGTGGTSVIDTSQVFYAGGSQGGILGGTVMAVSEVFDRGLLAVPASNYSTLLQRSADFVPFIPILLGTYPHHLDGIVLFPLIQQLWDRADSHAYLPHILPGDLSDPPFPHKVLLHMATYDCEVSNLGTEIEARSLGIPQVGPVARSFFGIPEVAAPYDGSGLVEVNPQKSESHCHTPDNGSTDKGAVCTNDSQCPGAGDPPSRTQCASGIPPLENLPPPFNNGAHTSTANPTTLMQIDRFMRNGGEIEQTCDGPCDPQ